MYDLEIIVPAEGKLTQRFADFKKWGIRNIGEYKICLVLAASNDNSESMFEGGWPEGIDVKIIKTPYKHVAQRIYHYYDSIIKPDTAKWYCRLDEDSMNDISGLMNNLELLFDHEREYHIVAELNWDAQDLEKELLIKIGLDCWFKNESAPPHEHEISITSNAAIRRIMANSKAKEYFRLRKEIANGYGDHGLCFCARMEKIHPTIAKFLSVRPELNQFSIFNGKLNHIHWVGRDTSPNVLNWLESIYPENESKFLNASYIWSDLNGDNKKLIALNSSNQIEEVQLQDDKPSKLGIWSTTKEGKLTFYLEEYEENDPPIVFEDISGSNEKITAYKCGNKLLRTGPLSALLKL